MDLRTRSGPEDINSKGSNGITITDAARPSDLLSSFKPTQEKFSFLKHFLFLSNLGLFKKALKLSKKNEQFKLEDIPQLAWKDRAEVLEAKVNQLLEADKKKNPNKKPSVAYAIFRATKWSILAGFLLEVSLIFLRIFTAYCAYKLLQILIFSNEPMYMGYVWAGILTVVIVVAMFCDHHSLYFKLLTPLYIRGAIMSMVYNKINKLSVYSLNKISLGKILNIVNNDVNVFERTGLYFICLVTGILGLIAGTALLWIWYNVTVLLGVGYIIFTFPLMKWVADFSMKPRFAQVQVTDERVKATSETIDGIKLLKMYAWEMLFGDHIKNIRLKELNLIKMIRLYDSVSRSIGFTSQNITSFLIFLLYDVTGGQLDVTKVFPTFFLVGIMRIYGTFFVGLGLAFIGEAKLFFSRLEDILNAPEIEQVTFPKPENSDHGIEFNDFSAYWSKNEKEVTPDAVSIDIPNKQEDNQSSQAESKPTISNVTLNINKGSLNALVGRVGSGKSSFLLAFTGEMPKTTGSLAYEGNIAYVEQEPTIFEGTFRECICFGKPFNQEFYDQVIKNCCLENDLKLFDNGDLSHIAEKGSNLSGGQKARLALARAVYCDADIYLLDDPLSAVDAKVAKSLYENAIKGLLKDKTVILATHQVHFVKDLENIMVIDEGKIVANGGYEKLKATYKDTDKVFSAEAKEEEKDIEADTNVVDPTAEEIEAAKLKEKLKEEEAKEFRVKEEQLENKPLLGEEKDLFDPEAEINNRVTLKTYKNYFSKMGIFNCLLTVFLFVLNNLASTAFGIFVAFWAGGKYSRGESIAIVGGITGFMVLCYIAQYIAFHLSILKAAKIYHNKMLERTIRNPSQFFDSNPLGQILSRFTNDIGVLDNFLPMIGIDSIELFLSILGSIITFGYLQPYTLLPIAGAALAIIVLTYFCYPAIKLSRDYELVSRGPVSTQFSSVLSGVIMIRSYKQVEAVTSKFRGLINTFTASSMTNALITRTFNFYLDFFYVLSSIGNIFLLTALGAGGNGFASFALILVLTVSIFLQYLLKALIQTHILMASASRIESYWRVPSEADLILHRDQELRKNRWPTQGEIDFKKIYMKYRPNTAFVIKDLNILVESGQKIGCIGRTGAGKSSIIQILFRMIEIDKAGDRKDSHVNIDGIDIQTLGLHLLRNKIGIIPQTPFIFSGTVRKNLDPIGENTDEELWSVLEDVNLKTHVQNLEKGLDTDMSNASSVFSVGQKQLICLARTILKKAKILVLDEATANVDQETDDFIQKKIREKFSDCTIFTIAHRLSTIANYDKVLVMDKGRKVEFDEPYKLLVKKLGDNAITNLSGDFASMVLNTGKKSARSIFKVTKETYERKYKQLDWNI